MDNKRPIVLKNPNHNNRQSLICCFKAWYDSPGIAVDGCLLTYMGPDFCKKCKVEILTTLTVPYSSLPLHQRHHDLR